MSSRNVAIFFKLAEISLLMIWLGLELFGHSEKVLSFVQSAVVILLYVAIVISCFAKLLGDVYSFYFNQQYRDWMRFVFVFARILTFAGRVVFEIVSIWTGVNALEYQRERSAYFSFTLALINLILIVLHLLPITYMYGVPKQAHVKA